MNYASHSSCPPFVLYGSGHVLCQLFKIHATFYRIVGGFSVGNQEGALDTSAATVLRGYAYAVPIACRLRLYITDSTLSGGRFACTG